MDIICIIMGFLTMLVAVVVEVNGRPEHGGSGGLYALAGAILLSAGGCFHYWVKFKAK